MYNFIARFPDRPNNLVKEVNVTAVNKIEAWSKLHLQYPFDKIEIVSMPIEISKNK